MSAAEALRGHDSVRVTPIALRLGTGNFGGGFRYPDSIEHVLEEIKGHRWEEKLGTLHAPLIIMGQECPSQIKGSPSQEYLHRFVRKEWGENWGVMYRENPEKDKLGTVFIWSPELEVVAEQVEVLPAPKPSMWDVGPMRVRQGHFAIFRQKDTNVYFAAANTHLDVYPPGKRGAAHRPNQMQAAEGHFSRFIASFREEAEERGEHLLILPFVGGDMNTGGGVGSKKNAREAQELLDALQAGGREYLELTDQTPSSNKLASARQAVVEHLPPRIVETVGHDFQRLYDLVPPGVRRSVRTHLMPHINNLINSADELRDRIYVQNINTDDLQLTDVASATVRLGERGQRPSPTDHRRTIVMFEGNVVSYQ